MIATANHAQQSRQPSAVSELVIVRQKTHDRKRKAYRRIRTIRGTYALHDGCAWAVSIWSSSGSNMLLLQLSDSR